MDGIFTGDAKNNASPSSQPETVLDNVYAVLTPFNRKSVTLTRDIEIAQDLDVDSVAIFDVIMDVEDRYEVTFPMEAISDIKTIGELTDMIEKLRTGTST